jgi:crotonobetainyl-CoA:carnitine CoA-transferase CaiB-like acyl-CoA transferase
MGTTRTEEPGSGPRRERDEGMGPLDGVKVLELAEYGFVPSGAGVLADWGADVVKVERLSGDPLRWIIKAGLLPDTGDFNFIVEQGNRNKRGVAIDIKTEDGKKVFDKLVAWADVFITSFLASTRTALGVNPEDLQTINPRLIYARGHGYGPQGPDADTPGFDSISYWARGGIGHMLSPPDGQMVMQRGAMGDFTAGAFLAGGIGAALYQRERTGKGGIVDVSLLNTAVWVLAPDLVATSVLGADPPRYTSGSLPNPLVGGRRTQDGRWLVLNMMEFDRYWPAFCAAIERPDLVDGERPADLHGFVDETIGAKPLSHWRTHMTAAGCVWSFLQAPIEVLEDVQVVANGYMPRHPDHDRARLASSPVQFDERPVEVRKGAPDVGADTDEVLAEIGVAGAEVARLREAGVIA